MARKRRKPKISQEERQRRRHYGSARAIFRNIGFTRVSGVSDREFTYQGQPGDFDDIFVGENVVILAEHTVSAVSKVGDHLKKKHILFQKISADPQAFLAFFRNKFPSVNAACDARYHEQNFIVRIVYNTLYDPSETTRHNVPEPRYLTYPMLKYFEKVSSIIKLSSAKEILGFLGIDPDDVGRAGKLQSVGSAYPYHGSILPESSSGFPSGFKVVSFYADPGALMDRAFVVRRDGWRSGTEAYQRMLQKPKIDQIRQKLRKSKTVFVNNLIATLPDDVHPIGQDGKTIDITSLKKTSPVKILLPKRPNLIPFIPYTHPDDGRVNRLSA